MNREETNFYIGLSSPSNPEIPGEGIYLIVPCAMPHSLLPAMASALSTRASGSQRKGQRRAFSHWKTLGTWLEEQDPLSMEVPSKKVDLIRGHANGCIGRNHRKAVSSWGCLCAMGTRETLQARTSLTSCCPLTSLLLLPGRTWLLFHHWDSELTIWVILLCSVHQKYPPEL
jgi:hypothetical protein